MSRFPALKTIAIVLKCFAAFSLAGGVVGAWTDDELLVRLGAISGGLLGALLLWAISELILVALAIESNTFLTQ